MSLPIRRRDHGAAIRRWRSAQNSNLIPHDGTIRLAGGPRTSRVHAPYMFDWLKWFHGRGILSSINLEFERENVWDAKNKPY